MTLSLHLFFDKHKETPLDKNLEMLSQLSDIPLQELASEQHPIFRLIKNIDDTAIKKLTLIYNCPKITSMIMKKPLTPNPTKQKKLFLFMMLAISAKKNEWYYQQLYKFMKHHHLKTFKSHKNGWFVQTENNRDVFVCKKFFLSLDERYTEGFFIGNVYSHESIFVKTKPKRGLSQN